MSDDVAERAYALLSQWGCELYKVRPSRDVTRAKVEQWLADYAANTSKGTGNDRS